MSVIIHTKYREENMTLTVLFDGQFYIGLLEHTMGGQYYACRHIFGAEPGESEIMQFVLHQMSALLSADSSPSSADEAPHMKINPKRLKRMAARQSEEKAISTKAQTAIKREQEQQTVERKQQSREEKLAKEEYKRGLKAAKKKQKHRGR
jgi:hypothetical protein